MSAAKRLVVCGGSGFVGSRICKYAVQRGWEVTSVSRSGEPKWDTVSSSPSPPSWSHKISWERADILRPATYAPLLKGADYVVHTMGILLEADYKGLVSGRESPITGIQKVFFSPATGRDRGVRKPLDREPGDDENIKPEDPADQFSYEIMNRDSAVMLAKKAAAENASAFLYLSAAGGIPVLPTRYIATKREAENTIASEFPRMRGVFVRAPFMYDSSRKFTLPMAAMAGAGSLFNTATGGFFGGLLGAGGAKPLPVETVAEAAVEALEDGKTSGPVELGEIEELANKSWRKNML